MRNKAQDWRRLVRSWHSLLAWALKIEPRDPEGAEILRLWAGEKARLLCEVSPGSIEAARKALADKKISRNRKRLRARGGGHKSEFL